MPNAARTGNTDVDRPWEEIMVVEERLNELDLFLPPAVISPPGVKLSFAWTRSFGDRVCVAGHGPQARDGSIARSDVLAPRSLPTRRIGLRSSRRCRCSAAFHASSGIWTV